MELSEEFGDICPWDDLSTVTSMMVARMFPVADDEHTQKEFESASCETQSLDVLHEAITKLLKGAESLDLIDKVVALLERSFQRQRDIVNLPVEDTLWCIGHWEHVLCVDDKVLRLMVLVDISSSQPATKFASLGYKTDICYEVQAMQLLCHACFHPLKKHPRRPRYLKLRNSPVAKGVVLDVAKFGIKFLNSDTSLDMIRETLTEEGPLWFRRCFNCGLKGTPDMFMTCSQCKAVVYCDEECQMASWRKRHRTWCKKFKSYMKMEHQLGELPFTFSKISTSQEFIRQKFKSFLEENDVYGKGLWRRECSSAEDASIAFGELLSPDKPYVLPLESAVLESPPLHRGLLHLDKYLQNWTEYYNYRGFWLDSPIAGLLHYPLTLYWITVHWLPQHYPSVFKKMKLTNSLQVHIIGAEKEAEMFQPFMESAHLLAPVNLHLHLFGDELSRAVHGKSTSKGNLTFELHSGLYQDCALNELPAPDLVVGFNAGLSAYSTFMKTVQMLLDKKTPVFCTDYCYYSIVHSQKALSRSRTGRMTKPSINPFRSPFHLVAEDMNLPRYSNAFIYCVKPWELTKEGCDVDTHGACEENFLH